MKIIIWPWSRDGAGLKDVEGFTTEPTLLVAAPPCSGGSLVPGPCLVPPVRDAQVAFTSRCHWWSTGRWDTHPKHELWTCWSSDCTRSTHRHRQKDLELRDFSFFLLFLFIALPARQGRENFQTVQKMRQQLPPLKHFCGCSREERDCRRAGSAFSAHFTLCSSCCESKVHPLEMCSGWMMPSAGSSPLPPECQEEFLQQKATCAERFTLLEPETEDPSSSTVSELRMGVRVTFSWSFHWGVAETGQGETLPSINQSASKEAPLPPNSGLQAQRFAIWVLKGCASPEAKGLFPPLNLLKKKKKNYVTTSTKHKSIKKENHGIDLPRYKYGLPPRLPFR